MAKRMMADVLWEAANERLWDGAGDYGRTLGVWRYSCDAILNDPSGLYAHRAKQSEFVSSLGCDTVSIRLFDEFRAGRQRQGVRYMWLLLAMHVAEDEGLTC